MMRPFSSRSHASLTPRGYVGNVVEDVVDGRRRRMRRIALVAAVASCSMVIGVGPAHAEERVCRGSLGAITVDNLRVPEGATCTLEGTRVRGTVKVEADATLRATGIRVIGNVQAEGARLVVVRGDSRVGGSVQVVQGGGSRVVRSTVEGDILFDENERALEARRNVVGGNLQAFQNSGGVEIRKNRIDGNLQCKENQPRPTGGGNVVGGNKEDQCARL
jgi:hypothetical protein